MPLLPTPITCTKVTIVIISLLLIAVVITYIKKIRKEKKVFKEPFQDDIDWDVNAK